LCGHLALVGMFIFEQPDISSILSAWAPLLYVGIMSSGVAYTLQIVGQRSTSPAVASLIMSLESVFALLSGMLILHQIPTAREIAGSALMFAAILAAQLVQLPPKPGIGTGRKTSGHA
jgi:drug/metabolite transporter (DMT)-like permease